MSFWTDERFSSPTVAALIEVVADVYTHKELNLLFRRLDVDYAEAREERRSLNKIERVEAAVDRLKSRGPAHGQDLLELVRSLIEECWQGEVREALREVRLAVTRLMTA